MLFLSNDDVRQVLTMRMTVDALEAAYRQLGEGEAICRPRIDLQIPTNTPGHTFQWGTMEGGSTTPGYFAIRMKSDIVYQAEYNGAVTEEKYSTRPGLFCGLIMLIGVQNAEPLAMMNDGYLQHFRVGADAGIGARYMAREDAHVVGMFGSGGMARSYLEALTLVRKVDRVQVFSPTREHREAYAREMAEHFDIEAVALESPQEVYRGADIVCACTDSAVPVIDGALLEPGTHLMRINGSFDAVTRDKIDVALRLGSAPGPIGLPEWQVDDERVVYAAGGSATPRAVDVVAGGERGRAHGRQQVRTTVSLQDLQLGRTTGRTSPEQITFSERGNLQGVQFFAVAGPVYEAARTAGLGRDLPTEWFLQDIRD